MINKITKVIIISLLILITGCSLNTFNQKNKAPILETNNFIENNDSNIKLVTDTFDDTFKQFQKININCEKKIDVPKPLFIENEGKELIGYTLEEHKKINQRILELKNCINNLKLLEDKYNLLLQTNNLYQQATKSDIEFKNKVIEIEKKRTQFLNQQISEYESIISKYEKKMFWNDVWNKVTFIGALLTIGITGR
jgi:hypothetical protein